MFFLSMLCYVIYVQGEIIKVLLLLGLLVYTRTPFENPSQVNASSVTSISLLSANEVRDISALKLFWDENASLFGQPCRFLRKINLPLLASPFGQGYRQAPVSNKQK